MPWERVVPYLTPYQKYSRKAVQEILAPKASYSPGSGIWGLQGVIDVRNEHKHFVFFVTYGRKHPSLQFFRKYFK